MIFIILHCLKTISRLAILSTKEQKRYKDPSFEYAYISIYKSHSKDFSKTNIRNSPASAKNIDIYCKI